MSPIRSYLYLQILTSKWHENSYIWRLVWCFNKFFEDINSKQRLLFTVYHISPRKSLFMHRNITIQQLSFSLKFDIKMPWTRLFSEIDLIFKRIFWLYQLKINANLLCVPYQPQKIAFHISHYHQSALIFSC